MKTYSSDDPRLTFRKSGPKIGGYGLTEKPVQKSLEVSVIFTNVAGTEAALEMAKRLAKELGARVQLLMPYEVPYALHLEEPQVPAEFLATRLRDLATHAGMEIDANLYLCRDRVRTLRHVLRPNSLVIVGGKKRWWPTPEQRMERALSQDGHIVVFTELR